MSVKKWIDEISNQFGENELEKLNTFRKEMKSFVELRERAMKQKDIRNSLVWEDVKPISSENLIQYNVLQKKKEVNDEKQLNPDSIIVLKLCGGLGTTMGLKKSKGLVVVRDGKTFLDFAIEQTIMTNRKYQANIPLVLMTSFFTHEAIVECVSNHPLRNEVEILIFQQKKFPRISAETFLPVSTSYSDPSQWTPPGHGDVYDSFLQSDIYTELKKRNKKYLFISNIDNLGAIVDISIFGHVVRNESEFTLEVTRKTLNDVKGGTVIEINGKLKLLEVAQVPPDHLNEFFSIDKFRIFNTNSMWISLPSLEKNLSNILSPIIFNRKNLNGKKIIQLETACGSAMESFEKVSVIEVPRIRRVTVKNCQDLFLAQSCLYDTIENGTRFIRRKRGDDEEIESPLPIIRFVGDEWKDLNTYNERIGKFGLPDISKLESLEVKGDVVFKSGKTISLEGVVKYDGVDHGIVL